MVGRLVRVGLGLALAVTVNGFNVGQAAAAPCHPSALTALKAASPEGYLIYQRLADKQDFLRWISCDDVQLGLSTAVHEGTHILTTQIDAYPLISGKTVPRVADSRAFFPPSRLAGRYRRDNSFVSTYLGPGAATSAEEFGFLLDELNAYSHDLNTSVKIAKLGSSDREVYYRDGLAALMSFVAVYVNEAKENVPETWAALRQRRVRSVVKTLWAQAETVMASSCRTRGYGVEAPEFLVPICKSTFYDGLGQLLERPPLCPVSCTPRRPNFVN